MSYPAYAYSAALRLGVPPTQIQTLIDVARLLSYVLPPVAGYFFAAVLAVKPKTHAVRLALWPVVALLALRASVSVDLSLGNPERKFLDIDLALCMFAIAVQTLQWTLAEGPLVRLLRPANSPPSVTMDAFDLAFNLRGHGWNWSRGLYVPREKRPGNRLAFVLCTLLSALVHTSMCGTFHRAVLSFAPVGTGPVPGGSTIFDDTLPFVAQYLRASIITLCTALAIYASLQAGYDACTVLAVLVFGQDPAQWPPAFDSPWLATSLSDFWGHRWHQWFRHTFLLLGRPLTLVFGRAGSVLGAFLASGVFHYLATLTLDGRAELWRMLVGFGMMALGIFAERAFRRATGRKVAGLVGWAWTTVWLIGWGSVIVEGFARAGMFGCSSYIDSALPVRFMVEQFVVSFDAWLHGV